jgi:hypothetical protein
MFVFVFTDFIYVRVSTCIPESWGQSCDCVSGQIRPLTTAFFIPQMSTSKAVPLHAMEALGRRVGIAPTHS